MNLSFSNVDQHLAKVELDGPFTPVVDLSNVTFFSPFALLYLGMYLRHHVTAGRYFNVLLPNDPKARAYLARMQFWERFHFDAEVVRRENLFRRPASSSWNDIVDIENSGDIGEELADRLLELLRHQNVQVNRNLLAELVCELVDNFAQHSTRQLAACMTQYFPNKHTFSFAIGDCGIGIRASLSMNPAHADIASKSHRSAAAEAFLPLVSRKHEGGMGLTQVAQGVKDEGGSLYLSTGDGYLTQDATNGRKIGTQKLDLTGVIVQITFPERR